MRDGVGNMRDRDAEGTCRVECNDQIKRATRIPAAPSALRAGPCGSACLLPRPCLSLLLPLSPPTTTAGAGIHACVRLQECELVCGIMAVV